MQEAESRTTRENAQYTQALLERQRINHILLVTSASHMRRASAVFAAQGFIVTAVSTDHQIPLLVGPVPGWLPTAERLSRSTRAIHEWVGYRVYSWLGYLRALRDRKPSVGAAPLLLDIELFEVAVVVTRPAPEGTIKAVYLSVAELPRHTFAG